MKYSETITLGFNAYPYISYKPLPNATHFEKLHYLSWIGNPQGCLLLALIQYLQQHRQYFDKINFIMTYERDANYINGTLGGLLKKSMILKLMLVFLPYI